MTTGEHLVARFLHQFEAVGVTANVSERRLHAWGRLLELIAAESTSFGILLIARLANVIWLAITLGAEIFSTCITSYSVFGHVPCRLLRYEITLIVFLTSDDLALDHLHHVTARAADHVRVVLDQAHYLALVYLLLVLFGDELPAFVVHDCLLAPGTLDRFTV